MRLLLLTAMLALFGCKAEGDTQVQNRLIVSTDYSLDAFGGRLLGTDLGEWRGKLYFQDADGKADVLLKENVRGIVQNQEGVFVFTGLAHLTLNEGYLYMVSRSQSGRVVVSRLGRLPGAPARVVQSGFGGVTSFLVYSGYSNDRQLFECYQLAGRVVSRGYDCLPPKQGAP